MSSSDNNSYMTEMTKSVNGLTGQSENSTDDETESFVQGRQTSSSSSSAETAGLISVCGLTTCFHGGRCDPVTQKCKCKGHHAGETAFSIQSSVKFYLGSYT